mmetsp:Transcript_10375/g.39248  ORF Transcript_10375/g.39248 Transcript_10375/m.39248 type:complete len:485 (-) Transcript_10375:305-1759(-)
MLLELLLVAISLVLAVPVLASCNRYLRRRRGVLEVAFFHPYASGGGGGERVLWVAIRALLEAEQAELAGGRRIRVTVYQGDQLATKASLLRHAKERFGVEIRPDLLNVVDVQLRHLVDPDRYPFLTMVFQALGSMILALEACLRFPPDVFVDSTGFAFSFPVAALLFRAVVACYVHYPTISADMMSRVVERRPSYNNGERITSSEALSRAKAVYYWAFGVLYGLCGSCASLVMTNSSWTQGHIRDVWGGWVRDVKRLYPPVDTVAFQKFPLEDRDPVVLSIGQFRPEKDHELQIRSFALLLKKLAGQNLPKSPTLVLVGGVRNEQDERLVSKLRSLCGALSLTVGEDVLFEINVPFDGLKRWLRVAAVGIHTMWNEHFGISVVEMQAAGLVVVAHGSGGPKSDIVQPRTDGQAEAATGFLATNEEEYAEAMVEAISIAHGEADASLKAELAMMRQEARRNAERFSDAVFEKALLEMIKPTLEKA